MSKFETISNKKTEFSEWYTQVLIKSGFFDYSLVSGCIVFRPDGYFIWESIQKITDQLFKEDELQNVYFPLLIPEKLLEKEKEHIKGFSPEVAWVTETGNSKLDERLAIRPTSETIIYDSVSKWIKSWRDLPLKLNQWCNVIRWEFKHPTPLLRNREFMWNEGHTIFASQEEADQERDKILDIYNRILKDYLAIPGIIGQKTETEKFAGAVASYSIELLLPDGKMIQGPDFHSDGQNFSKAFDIKFLDKEGKTRYVYQNTFAISTRIIGIMLATHGDDRGLVLPPKIAKTQIAIIPIYNTETKQKVLDYSNKIYNDIKQEFRTYFYDLDIYSPGKKFNECELKGIPIRIEIGKKEIEENTLTIAKRNNFEKEKIKINEIDLKVKINEILEQMNIELYNKAKLFLDSKIVFVKEYENLKKLILDSKIAQAPWCGDEKCEKQIKEDTTAKATNMPFDIQNKVKGEKCIYCDKNAKYIVNFAKSY